MKWDYGNYDQVYDMTGEIYLPNNSIIQVCDWIEYLPPFMKEADTLFIDPPWNKGNMNTFYFKAGLSHRSFDFMHFTAFLLKRIKEIAPETIFLEMGKEHLARYIMLIQQQFKYVTFYNSTYYHKQTNKCYIIHATQTAKHRRYKELEDLDEEDIIAWVCANHPYQCIGDLCMGTGLVGIHAAMRGKRFVGTELNPKRLAVLVHKLRAGGNRR